ncbi:MAG: hypothetical protein ACE5GH_05930, partial [Fidelibacterota bacterium]
LSNVNRSAIRRGSQLVTEGFMDTTGRMGAEISLLSRTERVIRHQQRVRLHVGTDEVMARVFLVSSDKQKTLQPGESGTALFRLDREIPLAMDDALILRFYSPTETIGGGVVIDTDPPARWNICRKWLGSLAGSTREDRMEKFLQASAKKPLTFQCHRSPVV